MRIAWSEVDAAAEEIFNVWIDKPEIAWARRTWARLAQRGLTSYKSEEERIRVLVRFMALGALYHHFCDRAFDESVTFSLNSWVEDLGISVTYDEESADDSYTTMPEIQEMLEEERRVLVKALLDEYESVSGLFTHFWRGLRPRENNLEIVNTNLTTGKHMAFEWISNGMEFWRT